ncbi:hypothetical protein [Alloactinosynnema sp. L-07]|uniref:hypothetical protein n=1 Tax=Alloactinosynnema sp. L-07 TaxID=1653480 RepID=UPI00065F04B1|nr:hypothetical protein [Alloactinosynnema sp. L-07]CRK59095.1 hypothetical protein [Alloactinosynnema sp. L-07]
MAAKTTTKKTADKAAIRDTFAAVYEMVREDVRDESIAEFRKYVAIELRAYLKAGDLDDDIEPAGGVTADWKAGFLAATKLIGDINFDF